jgi:hypothetical protein
MKRRNFIKTAAAGALAGATVRQAHAWLPEHHWTDHDFPDPTVRDRLNQGPFPDASLEGWNTIMSTTPKQGRTPNFGWGFCAYTWEEGGPPPNVRAGKESLEEGVEKLASLPFCDNLYIRCDWKHVQSKPGSLDLHPVWEESIKAAKRYNLRVSCRVQLSSPNHLPELAAPKFVVDNVPYVNIGRRRNRDYMEPRYDHPYFRNAFREMNKLLAERFNGDPMIEFVDVMGYGCWGEMHTNGLGNPFPDYQTAEKTFLDMAAQQVEAWDKTPLAMNTQPDADNVGNAQMLDFIMRHENWLRSDSIINDEPQQIEQLANRPPWSAVVMEAGGQRNYTPRDERRRPWLADGKLTLLEHQMEKVLDLGATHWSLWQSADNIRQYYKDHPHGIDVLNQRMGYRLRPSWVYWARRNGAVMLIPVIKNDGVSGVPGVVRLILETPDGRFRASGCLDPGLPDGGKLRFAEFVLPPDVKWHQVGLRAELETKGITRKIDWACAQELDSEGRLMMTQMPGCGWSEVPKG